MGTLTIEQTHAQTSFKLSKLDCEFLCLMLSFESRVHICARLGALSLQYNGSSESSIPSTHDLFLVVLLTDPNCIRDTRPAALFLWCPFLKPMDLYSKVVRLSLVALLSYSLFHLVLQTSLCKCHLQCKTVFCTTIWQSAGHNLTCNLGLWWSFGHSCTFTIQCGFK